MTDHGGHGAEGVVSSRWSRLPVWVQNSLVLIGLFAVAFAFVGAAMFCEHQGWTVAKYVIAVIGLVYDVFAVLALLGYLLYMLDQEVRRARL